MRTHQADRRSVALAVLTPAVFLVDDVALPAIGRAEILAGLGHAVELILRNAFRQPVAAVIGEIHLLVYGVPVETDTMAHPERIDLGAGAIQVHPADLAVRIVVQDVVAGLSDLNIN